MFHRYNFIFLLIIFVICPDFCSANNVMKISGILDDTEDCRNLPDLQFDPMKDINFSLYTGDNLVEPQNITIGNVSSLLLSNFRLHQIVKIHIHGVCGIPDIKHRLKSKGFFLETPGVNLIFVDWDKGSSGDLLQVSGVVPDVGKRIADFINWLVSYGVRLDDIHLIGSSMGSHVAGFAGRNVKNGQVSFILGCDPGIGLIRDEKDRLNRNDGKYVEVIHTNGAHHGILEPLGHVDFYPNGGLNMPGCSEGLCSHNAAYAYYIASLGSDNFVGYRCENFEEIIYGNCSKTGRLLLGGHYPKNATGIYYLETYPYSPYHKGA